jgi:hypothetical protein
MHCLVHSESSVVDRLTCLGEYATCSPKAMEHPWVDFQLNRNSGLLQTASEVNSFIEEWVNLSTH